MATKNVLIGRIYSLKEIENANKDRGTERAYLHLHSLPVVDRNFSCTYSRKSKFHERLYRRNYGAISCVDEFRHVGRGFPVSQMACNLLIHRILHI